MAQTPASSDKVIITNKAAMTAKYAATGLASIDTALSRLVAADSARGLTTVVVDISDQAQMAALGVSAVVNAADESGAKRAVDAIDLKISPDYFMLLDGPDVIPHITLQPVPGLNDGDPDIPSDLPYACAAPFSSNASDYLAVTRVVGRLPMSKGSADVNVLAKLIDFCATHAPKPATAYTSFFAMSTDTWKISTQLNLSALFGSQVSLNVSPTAGHAGIDPSLVSLGHLINCHGATHDPRFYGQKASSFPVAMSSSLVGPHITKGTLAAVECCYGAELFDSSLAAAGADPMSMVYLSGGAAAYVGSTNKAYGPFNTNGQADLMVQFFISTALKGASTGRAMLQARQRFVTTQKMADPRNLKTLAQFVLYGDPSIAPVDTDQTLIAATTRVGADGGTSVATVKEIFSRMATTVDARSARKSRRVALKSEGSAVASAATYLGAPARSGGAAKRRVEAIAKQRGFSGQISLFNVNGGSSFRSVTKSLDRKQQVAVTSQIEEHQDQESGARHTLVRVLVAHILGDGIVAVDESVSR